MKFDQMLMSVNCITEMQVMLMLDPALCMGSYEANMRLAPSIAPSMVMVPMSILWKHCHKLKQVSQVLENRWQLL